jgi:hypothetical protein
VRHVSDGATSATGNETSAPLSRLARPIRPQPLRTPQFGLPAAYRVHTRTALPADRNGVLRLSDGGAFAVYPKRHLDFQPPQLPSASLPSGGGGAGHRVLEGFTARAAASRPRLNDVRRDERVSNGEAHARRLIDEAAAFCSGDFLYPSSAGGPLGVVSAPRWSAHDGADHENDVNAANRNDGSVERQESVDSGDGTENAPKRSEEMMPVEATAGGLAPRPIERHAYATRSASSTRAPLRFVR